MSRRRLTGMLRFAGAAASDRFFVKNADTAAARTLNLSVACSGLSACGVAPASLTLEAGASGIATVSYTVGAAGTSGTATLTVTRSDNAGITSAAPLAVGSPAPVVSVADVNAGATVERGLCLTIAAGAAAAYECGDLRLVHALPAIRTLGKTRVPTLLYNSLHAEPSVTVVAAHVTLDAGAGLPDNVEAILRVNGVQRASGLWSGSDWTAGATRRIGLAYDASGDTTGAYDYTLEVAKLYGASRYPATVNGKLIVVNRRGSAFGAGWWLAGLERLEFPADGSRLWVGGDGSARVYRSAGTNVWVADNLARPDTLTWDGTSYTRTVPGGVRVLFDGAGLHVATINRLGHQTSFGYTAGRLTAITLPSQGGGQAYTLGYDATNRLTSVTAPGSRVTAVWRTGVRVDSLGDPDGTVVRFGYAGATNRIAGRTDRRGTVTSYGYDAAAKLWRMHLGLQPDSLVQQFGAIERWGLASLPAGSVERNARDPSGAYVVHYGPRTYATQASDRVTQLTTFWLDRHGAPVTVENALGHVTEVARRDGQYPALVTWQRRPNGAASSAGYDRRGNLAVSIDSVAVSGAYPTTRYAWDARWDAVTRIVPPEGDSTVLAYDAATGNRLWQQDARGTASRVTFGYFTTGLKAGLLQTVDGPLTPPAQYDYDALGNLTSQTTPLGFVRRSYGDALGRDTLSVTPIDGTTTERQRIVYDVMGRVDSTLALGPALSYGTTTVPAETLVVDHTYDLEGNLIEVFRRGFPDVNLIGGARTVYRFDRAHRRTVELEAGPADSIVTTYDPAGNVVATRTNRGLTISMTYDALNRLTQRVVPPVDYAQTTCADHTMFASCDYVFPVHPNNGTGLRIPADTAWFTYDVLGNLLTADNRSARITRSYYANGRLATDTVTLNGAKYGLRHEYDRNGRRATLHHPANLAPSSTQTVQQYAYTAFGLVSTVTSVSGQGYGFQYDGESRLTQVDFPGGSEQRSYDNDGRLIERTETVLNPTRTWHHETLSYDQRGRLLSVSKVGTPTLYWQGEMAYSGLGNLAMSNGADGAGYWAQEEFRQDPGAQAHWQYSTAPAPQSLEGDPEPPPVVPGLDGQSLRRGGERAAHVVAAVRAGAGPGRDHRGGVDQPAGDGELVRGG